jgi:hypothetical protein
VPTACLYLRRAVQAMAAEPPPDAPAAAAADGNDEAAEEGEEVEAIRRQRLLAALRCLMCTGEYVESLGPFLQCCGVDTICALLRHVQRPAAPAGGAPATAAQQRQGWLMHEALQVVCSLLAHRKFAELLVEAGGVQLLLALPRCAFSLAPKSTLASITPTILLNPTHPNPTQNPTHPQTGTSTPTPASPSPSSAWPPSPSPLSAPAPSPRRYRGTWSQPR